MSADGLAVELGERIGARRDFHVSELLETDQLSSIVRNGRMAALKKLLFRFPDLARVCHGLILLAADFGQQGAVETLVEYGADPNEHARTEDSWVDGTTALMLAAAVADVSLVRLLLDGGADPCLIDHTGRTAAEHCILSEERQRDPTWSRCAAECAVLIGSASALRRQQRARARWRVACAVVVMLRGWHLRAAERAYAPGGGAYDAASDSFRTAATSGGST